MNPTTMGSSPRPVLIYTDGSRIKQGIGAAMYCCTTQSTEHRYLGNDRDSMVCPGELESIHMVIIQVRELTTQTTRCCTFTDSQPAIKSLAKPWLQSGQSIVKRILDEIDELHRINPTYELNFEWDMLESKATRKRIRRQSMLQ